MLKFIDSHAHLTDSKYNITRESLINSLLSDGIKSVFTVAYDDISSKECVNLAKKYENIYAIRGVHPDEVKCYNAETERILLNLAKEPKVLAIGEIGLDYHNIPSNADIEKTKELQKQVFIKQLEIAHKSNLPVVIHTRDSLNDILLILEEHKNVLQNGGVIHCFLDGYEDYERIKKLGFKISVGGILTFKNAKSLQETIKLIDIQDIILETDCPYLTPEPFRGKVINEPKYTLYVASKLSELKNISIDKISEITNKNVQDVFKKYKG